MKHYLPEIVIALLLVAVAGLLWNPYWMPMGVFYVALVCFIVLFGGFAAFLWREKGGDEREELLRYVASRTSYLAGVSILALGIVLEAVRGHVDSWLAAAFIVMILAKLIGGALGRRRF